MGMERWREREGEKAYCVETGSLKSDSAIVTHPLLFARGLMS